MSLGKLVNVQTSSNESGSLSFFEVKDDFPFEIKRVYYIYNVDKNIVRGNHAHKKLKQMLWCPHGKIKITLDDGKSVKTYILDEPVKALFVSEGIWRKMQWLEDKSVLCVAASELYLEADYIRDYDEFIHMVNEGYWPNEN